MASEMIAKPVARERSSRLTTSTLSRLQDEYLVDQCEAMAKYSLRLGRTPEPRIVALVEGSRDVLLEAHESGDSKWQQLNADARVQLLEAHRQLSRNIAPTTPAAAQYIVDQQERAGRFTRLLGPVEIVRTISLLALLLLVVMVTSLAYSTSGTDAPATDGGGVTTAVQGGGLVVSTTSVAAASDAAGQAQTGFSFATEISILSAAALGAAFGSLYRLHTQLVSGEYDPQRDSLYFVEIVLGLIAGFVLAEMIPVSQVGDLGQVLTKPLLALLGGFSAPAVYRILARLVEAVETIVRGDPEERADSRVKQIEADVRETYEQRERAVAADVSEARVALARERLDEAVSTLDRLLGRLLRFDAP